jgi:hypothetical protein
VVVKKRFPYIANLIQAIPEGELQAADNLKIGSLEYLCWDPAQRAEALMQANALIREFICLYF